MYKALQVNKDTWWVGVNDLETDLFESLWTLPQGVAYNAYVVKGESATAAIDTVTGPWVDEYFRKVEEALEGRGLDYLVVNHMEPDHAGLISQLRSRWPDLKVVGNAKTLPIVGFSFDSKPVETEIGAVANVREAYALSLCTGAVDPDTALPDLLSKLDAAGMQKIVDEANAQLAAFLGE